MKLLAKIFLILTLAMTFPASVMASGHPLKGDFYGVNYTVPFAHAYRALGELGVDRKRAIDRDVYHFARLGFNAFRVHLWDVEISDGEGNLIENDHIDLLDYLIMRLEERGISVVLTAQTNFGNGYPERNTDPNGAYSYKYEKCKVHDNPEAVAAQERYVGMLVNHVNPYTGKAYKNDSSILAIEINNEPCHSGTAEEVTSYINRMAKKLRDSGWKKSVLYNVSHNLDITEGFYNADIDGTTFQWYPVGLVRGHTRSRNFLPFLDEYAIPFKGMPNYDKLSRVIYEFDPADNLKTYLYPACARTFRKEGFNWITQFAYDPIDMAWANTEYQTHFLNLAYTPGKALGMMIAAQVAYRTPLGTDYGRYPKNTTFGDFFIDAERDIAVLNDGKCFYYTNDNDIYPLCPETLESVAGVGSSDIVEYDGTGAYFLDKVSRDIWRLEIMPDVVLTRDPFSKPSLKRRVGEIINSENHISLHLPGLGNSFSVLNLSDNKVYSASNHTVKLTPGLYIISDNTESLRDIDKNQKLDNFNIRIGEYVAPASKEIKPQLTHSSKPVHFIGNTLTISAKRIGAVDSVMLYPSNISFWREDNVLLKLEKSCHPYEYTVDISNLEPLLKRNSSELSYNLVVFTPEGSFTYPGNIPGTPLDWDFDETSSNFYHTILINGDSEITIFENNGSSWMDFDRLSVPGFEGEISVIYKEITGLLPQETGNGYKMMVESRDWDNVRNLELLVTTKKGFSYSAPITSLGRGEADMTSLSPAATILCPEPFPVFMSRIHKPDEEAHFSQPFNIADVEVVAIVAYPSDTSKPAGLKIDRISLMPIQNNTIN